MPSIGSFRMGLKNHDASLSRICSPIRARVASARRLISARKVRFQRLGSGLAQRQPCRWQGIRRRRLAGKWHERRADERAEARIRVSTELRSRVCTDGGGALVVTRSTFDCASQTCAVSVAVYAVVTRGRRRCPMAPKAEGAPRRIRVAAVLLIAGLAAGPVGTHVYWMLGGTWGLHSSTSTGIRRGRRRGRAARRRDVGRPGAGRWWAAGVPVRPRDSVLRLVLGGVFLLETLAAFTWNMGVRVVAVRRLTRDRSARASCGGLGRPLASLPPAAADAAPHFERRHRGDANSSIPALAPVELVGRRRSVIRAEHLDEAARRGARGRRSVVCARGGR